MMMIMIDGDGTIRPLQPGEVAEADQHNAAMQDRVAYLMNQILEASQRAHDGDATGAAMISNQLTQDLQAFYKDKPLTLNLICYLLGQQCQAQQYTASVAETAAYLIGVLSQALPDEVRLPIGRLFEQHEPKETGDDR